MMLGTWINVLAILAGGAMGCLLGGKLPERLRQTVMAGVGLFTLAYSLQMFMKTHNALIVVGSIVLGALLGEWWGIEMGLEKLGAFLELRFTGVESTAGSRFLKGFLSTSLIVCIGPVAILGSIQDGLTGNVELLAVKSVLDFFIALTFASTFGVGVLFSALPILVYQGGITLLAGQVQTFITDVMMDELTATGGVILMGVAISGMLEIKRIRSGNFLPALFIAPLIVWIVNKLGLG